MKQKPRWMQSVIKAARAHEGPLPFGRHSSAVRYVSQPPAKPALAKT